MGKVGNVLELWHGKVDRTGRNACLGEHFPEVGLGLSSHFGHNLRSVDDVEIGARLVGHSTPDQRLTGTGRPIHHHSAWRLDPEVFEEGRVTEGQLYHFTDQGERFAAA